MRIGLIDSDLLDGGTRFPNLALMKLSGYHKNLGDTTELLLVWDAEVIASFDIVFVAKVFTSTKIPLDIESMTNVTYGGTGFFFENAPKLPDVVEHSFPDYSLYDEHVRRSLAAGVKKVKLEDYVNFSIGFLTRGCFRKCAFCVNKVYDRVVRHAPLSEFYDPNRKFIYLWDDNIMGSKYFEECLDELAATGKKFQFKQGLDIRLLTEKRAEKLASANYWGNFIFAFDDYADRELIEKKLKIWRKHAPKRGTSLYVLVAYKSQGAEDIVEAFKRIVILMKYDCLPFIMKYNAYEDSFYRGMYITIARWCNQPSFFKKKSFREFCYANGETSAAVRYMKDFESRHPEIAKEYFDIRADESKEESLWK